jgi:hypothetical protein
MKHAIGIAIALALAGVACSDTGVPTAPTPVPASITDTFNGTLTVSGTSAQPFTVKQAGHLTVTLDTVQPAAAVGIGIGTPSAGGCAVVSRQAPVLPGGTFVLSGIALAGNLCVSVYDVGNLVETVTYTITVFHS